MQFLIQGGDPICIDHICIDHLALQIKDGDKSKTEILMEKVQPLTLSMIKKYGYYDTFEENYQNAMVQLLEAIEEFDPSSQVFFAVFYKKKLFYFFMMVIREQADKLDFSESMPPFETPKDENLVEPDKNLDRIIWRENSTDIQKAIMKLTPKQQWIIEEHFYKGKMLTQIAKENDRHPQTMTKLKDRALKALKIELLKVIEN